jgi:hypothetical protein
LSIKLGTTDPADFKLGTTDVAKLCIGTTEVYSATTTPSAPQSLSASAGDTQVALSWSAPASDGGATVTGYKVYQSTDDASFSEVATPSGTSQTITGLTNGTTYYFKVAAVNSVGTGTQTSSVSASPSASATAPSVPQSLSATRGNTQVALSWSAPSSDGGATITGYKVYQSTDDASFSEVATPSGTSHTITGLTNGTTYYFKVAAVNSVGTGTQTSSVNAVPATTPGVPQSLSGTRGNTQVALSWSAPSSNGGTAVTGYKVYQSTDDASFSEVATPSGTSHTVTGLTNGTTYYFKVAAVNAVGTGTQTSSVSAVPATNPGVPQSLSATHGNAQVALSWSAPASNGGTAVTGYKVYQSTDDASFSEVATPSGTSHTVTSLTNGTQYYFKVAAVNAVGTGSQTSSVNATPATTPAAPTSLAATNGDTQSVLTWTAPTNTGGSAITGYKVKWGATSGFPGNAAYISTGSTSATYTKTSLTNGTQYSFQVAAINAEGDGTYSSTATATPAAAVVSNPDSLWGAVRLLVPFETSANSVTHADGQQVSGTESGTSGSPSSAVSTDGKFSNGFRYFQGTVTYSTGTFNSTNWTVEFWFKRITDYSFTTQRQAMKFGDFIFRHTTSNNFILYDDDDGSAIGSFGTAALNTWEHYAIVYQNGTMRLYKGGTQVASSTGTLSAPSSVVIGRSSSGLYNFGLDDLRVTDTARYPDGTSFSVPTAAHGTSSGTGKIDVNNDKIARFYLPASQTTFRVSANTSSGYFKVSSPGKTDVIGNDHTTMYPTYYLSGGNTYVEMSGLSSSAAKTVTVSPCNSGGTITGNIIGIDIGTDSTNNVDAVDISGLTSLTTCNLGASGATLSGSKGMGAPIGSRSMASSITEIRAVNVDFSTGGGAYYSPTWTPQVYVYGGGLDLYNQDLDATALNQLYTDLSSGTGGGDIYVGQNPGTGSDNTSLASNYTIYGS